MFKIILSFISMILIVSCSSGVSQSDYNQLLSAHNQLNSSYGKTVENVNLLIQNQNGFNSTLNEAIEIQNELVEKYNDVINTGTIVVQSDSEAIKSLTQQLNELKNSQNNNTEAVKFNTLNSRITKLENSTTSSAAPSNIESKLASKVDLIDYNKFVSDYNQLVNYVNNLPKGSSSSQSQASVGNLDANLLRQIMCVQAQNWDKLNATINITDYVQNQKPLNDWQAINCGTVRGATTAQERLQTLRGISGAAKDFLHDFSREYWWR